MQVQFRIEGEPFGKQRPRLSKFGTYTPKETVNYENWVKLKYLEQVKEENRMMVGPVRAIISAFYSIPKSASNRKRTKMIKGEIIPEKKPDCDNIAKAILDALNKVAYDDDKQVVELFVRKRYSLEPYVLVTLETIDNVEY